MLDNKVHGNNWDKSDPNTLKKKKTKPPKSAKKKMKLNFQI